MNRRPSEPLSPEERALADQLARLGPHGEPSPTLDARILAAAHDAVVAQRPARRKPRWPVAMGLAASALLAVGIAWQLRPVDETPQASEMPAPHVVTPVMDAEPAAASPAAMTAPPSLPQQAASAATASEKTVAAPAASKPAALPRPARHAPPLVEADQRARTLGGNLPGRAQPRPTDSYAAAPPPPPAAPPAPAAALEAAATASYAYEAVPVASDDELLDRPGSVAPPATTAAIAAQREKARAEQARDAADAADAARASEVRARTAQARSASVNGNVAAPVAVVSAPMPAATSGPVRSALKRTDLQLPVSEDTRLPPEDWLERIRLRRDLGDRASAVDSLLRFKQNHPFQKIPDDLRELLGE